MVIIQKKLNHHGTVMLLVNSSDIKISMLPLDVSLPEVIDRYYHINCHRNMVKLFLKLYL